MKSNVAHVVYRNLLSQSGHGYPLWIPGPDLSLPHAYQQRGINVGDVGILTERGGFDFLFNIHEAADSSANDGQVPPGFEPWLLDKRDTSVQPFIHKERGSVVSCNVSRKSIALEAEAELGFVAGGGFGVEFSTEKDQAAVLVLPHGATGYDAKNRAAYEDYAKLNAKSWCGYAESLGRGRTHLYLVTGCDKARSWGAAAVSRPSQTRSVSLKFLAGGLAGAAVSFHSSWSHDFGVESRLHPPSAGSSSLEETQCVFTRGFTIAVRQSPISRVIKGTVGVSSSTSIPTFRSSSSTRFPLLPGSRPPRRPLPERLMPPRMDPNGRTYQSAAPVIVESEGDDWAIAESAFDNATALAKESDSDVLISSFPSESEQSRNLSSVMCDTILEEHDDVEVAIVHDEAWIPNARQSGLKDEYFVWPESSIMKDGDGYATVNITENKQASVPPSLPISIKTGRSPHHSRSGAAMVTPLNNYLQSMGRLGSLKWVETSSGPQNNPTWRVDCYIDGDHYGSGTASNKSIAKGIAAGAALDTLTWANT